MSKTSSSQQKVNEIIQKLEEYAAPLAKEGMARFGIKTEYALGVSIPNLRKIAKENDKDNQLAIKLWKTKIHEARILATMIADSKLVTEKQMESWVKDFNSWDLCDQCCGNLFDKTKFAYRKAIKWSSDRREFIKRAGFVMMACLAVHDKNAGDKEFLRFLPIIKREANDNRNFVKKAVNWALRQIGKRNVNLHKMAIKTAKEIQKLDSRSAKWIASDAIRELESESVGKRLNEEIYARSNVL